MYSYSPLYYPIPLTPIPVLRNYSEFGSSTSNSTMVIPPYLCPMATSAVTSTIHQDNSSSSTKQMHLYKTEYCRNWSELGECRYGKKCRYAHGDGELRSVARHSHYRTQPCRTYHTQGTCQYGNRCTFIHDYEGMTTIGGNNLWVDQLFTVDDDDTGGEINQKVKDGSVTDTGNVRQHSRFFSTNKNISKDHQVPLVRPSPPPPPSPLPLAEAPKSPAAATVQFQNNKGLWHSKLGFGSPQTLAHALNLVDQQQGFSTTPILTSTPVITTQADDLLTPVFGTAAYDATLRRHPRSYSLPISNASMNRHSHPAGVHLRPSHVCYDQPNHHHLNAATTQDTGISGHWNPLNTAAAGGGRRRGSYAS